MTIGEESSWASSVDEGALTASDKLVRGLDEAVAVIGDVLRESSDVLVKYRVEYDAALTSFQVDIGVIDEELERLTNEQKRRRKKVDDDASVSWSVAFAETESSGADVFVLPSDEASIDITLLSDEPSLEGILESEPTTAAGKNEKATKDRKEKARMESVSNLITTMQAFQDEEQSLLQRLESENGMTELTREERLDLEEKLEECRALQTQQVVASVTDYKPRFKASSKTTKSTGLGLNLPSIEDLLGGVAADTAPVGPIVRGASKGSHSKRRQQTPKRGKSIPKASKGSALVKGHTNTPATTQEALADPANFHGVHELAVEKPRRSKGLSSLVKNNTRPLNAMEMGRRNRVGRRR